jgi:hypothetical protein
MYGSRAKRQSSTTVFGKLSFDLWRVGVSPETFLLLHGVVAGRHAVKNTVLVPVVLPAMSISLFAAASSCYPTPRKHASQGNVECLEHSPALDVGEKFVGLSHEVIMLVTHFYRFCLVHRYSA